MVYHSAGRVPGVTVSLEAPLPAMTVKISGVAVALPRVLQAVKMEIAEEAGSPSPLLQARRAQLCPSHSDPHPCTCAGSHGGTQLRYGASPGVKGLKHVGSGPPLATRASPGCTTKAHEASRCSEQKGTC